MRNSVPVRVSILLLCRAEQGKPCSFPLTVTRSNSFRRFIGLVKYAMEVQEAEENKALILRMLESGNQQNQAETEEFIAPTLVIHDVDKSEVHGTEL